MTTISVHFEDDEARFVRTAYPEDSALIEAVRESVLERAGERLLDIQKSRSEGT